MKYLPHITAFLILALFFCLSLLYRQNIVIKLLATKTKESALSSAEIENYYINKYSEGTKKGEIFTLQIKSFDSNMYMGEVGTHPKSCGKSPEEADDYDYCGDNLFVLTKINGVIVSEETNTDFGDCSSLKKKGFDISIVNKLTQACQ